VTAGLVVGIETSCDETAVAVVERGSTVRASLVRSQVDLHERFGGVVPEIASRAHVAALPGMVDLALAEAGLSSLVGGGGERSGTAWRDGVAAVAATVGPGLIGSLLVGVTSAKALALAWGVPFVGVNHLEAHLYAAFLERSELPLPAVVLLVSGGHTMLVLMEDRGRYRLLGETVDDAAGEAFDKVARHLGLGYPGGPVIDRLAREGDPAAIRFPRSMLERAYAFSFSGLKTSVVRHVAAHPEQSLADVAASFQEAVVDVLLQKARRALSEFGARGLVLAGGVAANSRLREAAVAVGEEEGVEVFLPSRAMCTDNAAMVAAAGWWRLRSDGPSSLDVGAEADLPFPALA
jgi:N6-L-threonylcarbamoyladenine synthase